MLRIKETLRQAIIDHALKDAPIEACGVIAGKNFCGNDTDRLIKMDNMAEEWGTSFEFDPHQQLAVWNDMETRREVPVVIYHSHTKHRAQPSNRDVDGAVLRQTHHVIVSTLDRESPEFRSFVLQNGNLIEESIEVLEWKQ